MTDETDEIPPGARPSVSDLIYAYLEGRTGSRRAASAPRRADVVPVLRRDADASFSALADYDGRCPDGLDPRDLGRPLGRLLSSIADLVPERMVARMTTGDWGVRYMFIAAAAASESPLFVEPIIDLLTDRSIYIKTLVLRMIVQWPHLQVAAAVPRLERLAKFKAFQNSAGDRELLESARNAIRGSE